MSVPSPVFRRCTAPLIFFGIILLSLIEHYRACYSIMGKKPSSSQPPADNAGGAGSLSLNATAKFAVLDAPGITQSVVPPASASAASAAGKAAADGSAATAGGGLQGRRAKAGAGPRMDQGAGDGDDDGAILIGGNSFLERTKMPAWIKVCIL